MRARRSITFPYQSYKGLLCPIIPVEINGTFIDAYVDSGAFFSIFKVEVAQFLGINYRTGHPSSIMVGDGNLIPVFFHSLTIKIGGVSLKATIGFSAKLGVGFNLLGRRDIFNKFKIVFDDASQILTFIPAGSRR